jgi:F-type H+-transporting ATPase subunit epsilon
MANTFKLSVVAPDRTVTEGEVTSIVAPGVNGYVGILAGHVPMIMALRPGILEYLGVDNQRHFVSIGGGFMEVNQTAAVVLAEQAQHSNEIDLKEAEEQLEKARKALRGESADMSREEAQEELERAMARVKAARLN